MDTHAVVMQQPGRLSLSRLELQVPTADDIVVQVQWSGISTGTERLLWSGRMPDFPGMGYPLVPGYESVGIVVDAGERSGHHPGDQVFVPGARCYGDVRGLFGGASATVVLPGARAVALGDGFGESGVLLALAATAYHAVAGGGTRAHEQIHPPDLIVGHGVLGRLLARLNMAAGFHDFVVWETDPARATGATGYPVIDPADDARRDYRAIYDVSGDPGVLDQLVLRLAAGGEIVLAGFYSEPLRFSFAPAFMREAQIRCAAEWKRADILAVTELASLGLFSFDGLITHHCAADDAVRAYPTAFEDPGCLKMVLDWRQFS